jgi:DNA polymerase III gamma/tau subunit
MKDVLIKEFGKEAPGKANEKVLGRIAEVADGSARKALVILDQVVGIEGEEEKLNVVQKSDARKSAFDLAKSMLWDRGDWNKTVEILNNLEDGEDWEGIRYLILSCATKELLKNSGLRERAARLISKFQFNWHDTKKAGLVLACHDFFFTE